MTATGLLDRRRRGATAGAALALTLALAIVGAQAVRSCPFCNAAMQTLSEEIASSDMAAIVTLSSEQATSPAATTDEPAAATPPTRFRVVEPVHGGEKLQGVETVETIYFGSEPQGKMFLLTALNLEGKSEWTTPIPLSDSGVEYVRRLPKLPAGGADRLAFFQDHLEDDDPLLAQDAYDEFSRAPYDDVVALGPRMNRERLLKWIEDPLVGPSGRRLYVTMLGVCARPEDVKLLEQMLSHDYQAMKPGINAAVAAWSVGGGFATAGLLDEALHADERRRKDSLDALVACYLKLQGPRGLELVNRLFLANPQVEYKYLHAAIMALRFHGEQTDVLPRQALLDSIRLALDHPEFADQVIPDLTRWSDWEIMPRLVQMFKDADDDGWIRQPVASYLLVAADEPGEVGQRAQGALAELEQIDQPTITRARDLSAFNLLPRTMAPRPAESDPAAAAGGASTATPTEPPSEPASTAVAQGASASPNAPAPPAPPALVETPVPSRTKIIVVPLVAVVVLLGVLAILLRGSDPRSSDESP